MRSHRLQQVILVLAALLLCTSSTPGWCAQSNDQQPSTGPSPDVNETVLIPKKTQSAPAPEKKPERINPDEVFTLSTSTNLVNIDVMVLDKEGNPVPSLGRKNFAVSDDGVPQTVSNFGTADAPMTTCLLIEFSNKNWVYLYLAKKYSYDYLHYIQPKDWTAVVSFDLKPDILADFTQDRSEVAGALNTLQFPLFSEINLYDALSFTLDRMKDVKGRKSIILLCTGVDTFSKLTYDKILKIVRSSDTTIYPISILEFMSVRSPRGDSLTTLQARNALDTIAKYSGGQAFFPRFETELPEIYQQISGQLRLQYSLGFVPTNPAKDGKFHKLKIDLVDDQGNPLRIVNQKGKVVKYHIVSREGYYAPKS